MSLKKALKTVFRLYEQNQVVGHNQIKGVARSYNVNVSHLEKAIYDKGMDLVAYHR